MRQKSSSMFARLSIELYRSMQTLYNHWPLMLGSRYPWNPILWVVTIFEAHFLATFLCSLCLNLIDQNPFNSTYFNSGEDKKKGVRWFTTPFQPYKRHYWSLSNISLVIVIIAGFCWFKSTFCRPGAWWSEAVLRLRLPAWTPNSSKRWP